MTILGEILGGLFVGSLIALCGLPDAEKMAKKKVNKEITIDMFKQCIPWEQIEDIIGKRKYKQFQKWMQGQTNPIGGVYKWDLDRFLKGLPVID